MLTRDVEMVGRFEAHKLPDGSTLYYEPEKHGYYGSIKPSKSAKGGYSFDRSSRLTGVSTIAKHLDADADPLIHWGVNLDHQGIAALVAADMERGASLDWLTNPDAIKVRLREHNLTWSDVREQMAEWGTNVHEHVFLELAQDRIPNLADRSEEERGFGQGVMRWWRDRAPRIEMAEQVTVSHDKRFAGRFDALGWIDVDRLDPDNLPPIDLADRTEIRVLADAKTRTSGKDRKGDHVQPVGYDVANRDCGIGRADALLALLLMPDGNYREVWSRATDEKFYAALNACRAGKELDKDMRQSHKAREAVAV